MRAIDADALYQEMVRTIVAMMRTKRWMRSDKDNEDEILLVIQNAPTLDYAPVRHGEWVRQDETYTRFQCSSCKSENHGRRWPFCPICGAKMDGGKKDG